MADDYDGNRIATFICYVSIFSFFVGL